MTTRQPVRGRVSVPDALLAGVLAAGAVLVGVAGPSDQPLDIVGGLLLVAAAGVLTVRRVWPGAVLVAEIVITVPYHRSGYLHEAAAVPLLIALVTYAAYNTRRRSIVVGCAILGFVVGGMSVADDDGPDLRDRGGMVGWVLAAVIAGQAWRSHRAYVGAIIDRADRAERTREEEARRRVAEERLRIARDLHDLLAHSITLIGVQAGVAAHLAAQDPPAEQALLVGVLDTITDTCRDARHELRATLEVLRDADDNSPSYEAVPGLAGLAELVPLVSAARSAGIDVRLTGHDGLAPTPEVGVAVYRIVQEALTNVVKHSGARVVDVELTRRDGELRVSIADDGGGAGSVEDNGDGRGFGILGMAERARSVGGRLDAGPGGAGGFTVTAMLPMGEREIE